MDNREENLFLIEIVKADQGYHVEMKSSSQRFEHTLKEDFSDIYFIVKFTELEKSLYSEFKQFEKGEIKTFGKKLFTILFKEKGKKLLTDSLNTCRRKRKPLRIFLIADDPKTHKIPWEVMYCEDEKLFLGGSSFVTFSRGVPGFTDEGMPPLTPPLTLLFLISSPLDLPEYTYEVDIGEIERNLQDPLESLYKKGVITYEFFDDARQDKLMRKADQGWDIIHLFAHGIMEKGTSYILMEDTKRKCTQKSAEELSEIFSVRPRLTFFCSCESAKMPLRELYTTVPFVFLKRGFPAVIAMQYSVLVDVADRFSKYFYEMVTENVDEAVAKARMMIRQEVGDDDVSWFTPVLYANSYQPLLPIKGSPSPPKKEKRIDFLRELPPSKAFFGRRKERIAIETSFFEKRRNFVLISGIGGIGKSSLAREVADRNRDRVEGIFAKRVAADFDVAEFVDNLKDFLRLHGEDVTQLDADIAVTDKLEVVRGILEDTSYLVIVDNVDDHVREKRIVSYDMKKLFEVFSSLKGLTRVIVTSREGIEGYNLEKVDVGDLKIFNCYRLLRDVGIELSWDDLEHVYERMGGNPQYYVWLSSLWEREGSDILDILSKTDKKMDEWLLDELFERASVFGGDEVMKQISVFRNPFTREVFGLVGASDEVVRKLMDVNLLKVEEYYFVHGLVKEYVRKRMSLDERRAAHKMAVKYYYEKDFLELHYHMVKAGMFKEAAKLGLSVVFDIIKRGNLGLAFKLNASATLGTAEDKSLAYYYIGVVKYLVGEHDEALKYYNKSLEIEEKLKNVSGIATTYHQIGMIHQDRGDYDEALKYYNKSLEKEEKLKNLSGIATTYHNIGNIHYLRGDYDEALKYYNKSLEIKEKLKDLSGIATTYHQIGMIHQDRGDYDEALKYYNKSLEIEEKLKNVSGIATTYHNIGNIHYLRGDYDEALKYYNKSLEINEKLKNVSGIATTYHQIGMIHQDRGDYDEALKYYNKSLEINEKLKNVSGIAIAYHQIGNIHYQRRDYDEALKYYNKSLEIKEKLKDLSGIATTYGQIGRIYSGKKKYKTALKLFISALQIFQYLHSPYAELVESDIAQIMNELGKKEFQKLLKEIEEESQ